MTSAQLIRAGLELINRLWSEADHVDPAVDSGGQPQLCVALHLTSTYD